MRCERKFQFVLQIPEPAGGALRRIVGVNDHLHRDAFFAIEIPLWTTPPTPSRSALLQSRHADRFVTELLHSVSLERPQSLRSL
jgi:hypothetical protein